MNPTASKKHEYMLGGQRQKLSTVPKGKIPPLVIDYLLQEGEFDPRSSKKVHFASVVAKNAGQQGDEHLPAARHQQQATASLAGPLPSLASGGEGGPFFDDGIDIKASDTPTSSKSLSPLPSFSFTTSSPLILHQSQLISPSQRHVNRIWRAGDSLQLILRVLVEFDDGSEKKTWKFWLIHIWFFPPKIQWISSLRMGNGWMVGKIV